MKIIEKSISEIIPYANNPRNNEAAVDAVAASIREFGFKVPIIIDKNNVIVAGHTRLRSAEKLGLESVPCVLADDLTEEQVRAFRIADNKTAELADWDFTKLEEELAALKEIDMSEFGFLDEIDELEQKKEEFRARMEAGELSEDSEEYQEFLQKFEAKKTTDDCYTPEIIYEAIAAWVAKEYGVSRSRFVRPFYPGGDYQKEKYKSGDIVVDNPPFSILAQIIRWYDENGIKFFLFAPALTVFSSSSSSHACAICTGASVTYENGANVLTSFVTNMEEYRCRTAPELRRVVDEADKKNLAETRRELPKYSYPDNVVTAAALNYLSRYGADIRIPREESEKIRGGLDAQKEVGKAIFGNGYFISDRLAAEKAAAEKAAAEKAAATRWQLSDREKEIVKGLNVKAS